MSPLPHDEDEVPITVDVYGIKTYATPSDLGEPQPTSWREVREQVKGHLFRLAAAPTRFVVEALEGATRMVRGMSRLPSSAAKRLERSHDEADRREQARQKHSQTDPRRALPAAAEEQFNASEAALARIGEVLKYYRDRGYESFVATLHDGKTVIFFGLPQASPDAIQELLRNATAVERGEEAGPG